LPSNFADVNQQPFQNIFPSVQVHAPHSARVIGMGEAAFDQLPTPAQPFQSMRPDRLVIRRFEKLCAYLKENPKGFRVVTFGERPQLESEPQAASFAHMGWLLPAARKLVQAVNRVYWI
jgi:hypothetical protein